MFADKPDTNDLHELLKKSEALAARSTVARRVGHKAAAYLQSLSRLAEECVDGAQEAVRYATDVGKVQREELSHLYAQWHCVIRYRDLVTLYIGKDHAAAVAAYNPAVTVMASHHLMGEVERLAAIEAGKKLRTLRVTR